MNLNHDFVAGHVGGDSDRARLRSMLYGIGDEVREHLSNTNGIDSAARIFVAMQLDRAVRVGCRKRCDSLFKN